MEKLFTLIMLFVATGIISAFAQNTSNGSSSGGSDGKSTMRETYYLLGPQSDGEANIDFFNTALKLQPVQGSSSKYYIDIPAQYPYEFGNNLTQNCFLNFGQILTNTDYQKAGLASGTTTGIKDKDHFTVKVPNQLKQYKESSFFDIQQKVTSYWWPIPTISDLNNAKCFYVYNYNQKLLVVRLWNNTYSYNDFTFWDGTTYEEFINFVNKANKAYEAQSTTTDEVKTKLVNALYADFFNKFKTYFDQKGLSFYLAKGSTIRKVHNGMSEADGMKELLVPKAKTNAGAEEKNSGNYWVYGTTHKSGALTGYDGANKQRWEVRFANVYRQSDIKKSLEVVHSDIDPSEGNSSGVDILRLKQSARNQLLLDGSYHFVIDVATGTWSVDYQEKRVAYMSYFTNKWSKWQIEGTYTLYQEKNEDGLYTNRFTTPYSYIYQNADADGNEYTYSFLSNTKNITGNAQFLGMKWKKDGYPDNSLDKYLPEMAIASNPYLNASGPSSEFADNNTIYAGCRKTHGKGWTSGESPFGEGGYFDLTLYPYSIVDDGGLVKVKGDGRTGSLKSVYLVNGAEKVGSGKNEYGGALSTDRPVKLSYKPSLQAYSVLISSDQFHNGKFYFVGRDNDDADVTTFRDGDYLFSNVGKIDFPTVEKPNTQKYFQIDWWDADITNFVQFWQKTFGGVNNTPIRATLNTFKDNDDNYKGWYRINLYITSDKTAKYTIEKVSNKYRDVRVVGDGVNAPWGDALKTTSPMVGKQMQLVDDGNGYHYEIVLKQGEFNQYNGRFFFEALDNEGKKRFIGKFTSVKDANDVDKYKYDLFGYDNATISAYKNAQNAPFGSDGNVVTYKYNDKDYALSMIASTGSVIIKFWPLYGEYSAYTINALENHLLIVGKKTKTTYYTWYGAYRQTITKEDAALAEDKEITKADNGAYSITLNANEVIPGKKFYFYQTFENRDEKDLVYGEGSKSVGTDGNINSYIAYGYDAESTNEYEGSTLSNWFKEIFGIDHFEYAVFPVFANKEHIKQYVITFVNGKFGNIGWIGNYTIKPIYDGKVADEDNRSKVSIDFTDNGVTADGQPRYIRTYSNSAYSFDLKDPKNLTNGSQKVKAYVANKVEFASEANIDGTKSLMVYLKEVDDIHARNGVVLIPTEDAIKGAVDGKLTVNLKPEGTTNDRLYAEDGITNYLEPSNEGCHVNFEDVSNGIVTSRNYFLSTWHKTVDYVEFGGDDYVGFFRAISSDLGANKAFLRLTTDADLFTENGRQLGGYNLVNNDVEGAQLSKFGVMLVFDDIDDPSTTGINAVENASNKNDGAYYTLAGIKVTNPVKGQVYIHNGKKVMILK